MGQWTRAEALDILKKCELIEESVEELRKKAKAVLEDEAPVVVPFKRSDHA